jgi:hypothetical protein
MVFQNPAHCTYGINAKLYRRVDTANGCLNLKTKSAVLIDDVMIGSGPFVIEIWLEIQTSLSHQLRA